MSVRRKVTPSPDYFLENETRNVPAALLFFSIVRRAIVLKTLLSGATSGMLAGLSKCRLDCTQRARDYGNHGGWSDPYSSAALSDRQRDYARKLGLDSVCTPQLIVDGAAEFVGSNAAQARTEITKTAASTKLPKARDRQCSRKYVSLELYTDGKDAASTQIRSLEQRKFSTVALPYYAILDSQEKEVAHQPGLTGDPQHFLSVLSTRS